MPAPLEPVSLQPLIDKFAAEGTALNIVLFLLLVFAGVMAFFRTRRIDRLQDRSVLVAEMTAKAGLAQAEAVRVSTEEARLQRDGRDRERESLERHTEALNRLVRELRKRSP